MIVIEIPGHTTLRISHLVLDYNGTLACDGKLIDGVRQCLNTLAEKLEIHVVTADTFGRAKEALAEISCRTVIIPREKQDTSKQDYIMKIGRSSVVCIGNGRNDCLMLQEAALGIAVIQEEGAAGAALQTADVICSSITAALNLLIFPLRLIATLRC